MHLAYKECGVGPAVVLLHGFPFDGSIWQAQAADLSNGYRILLPDLPGFGESTGAPQPRSIDDMADEVIALLDHLGLTEPLVIGGLSMGGYVALSLAARFPERLRGLMLIDTKAAADTPDAAETRRKTAAAIEASGDISGLVDGMIPRLFGPATQASNRDVIVPVERVMRRTPVPAVAAALRAMAARPDRTGDLATISVPSLVLVGADDMISTPEEARAIAEALPQGRLVVLPGVGHMAVVEFPAAASEAMRAFLDANR